MSNAPKPALIPLTVPWCVSLSTPALHITASENSIYGPATLDLVAFTILPSELFPESGGSTLVPAWRPPVELELIARQPAIREYMISISFDRARALLMSPAYSDSDTIDPSAYDRALTQPRLPRESFEAHLFRQREEWLRTGKCPDPGIYEVLESPSLRSGSSDRTRFLIVGHDSWMTIDAKAYHWTILREMKAKDFEQLGMLDTEDLSK